ncbi:abortive infection protein [Neptunitalea chrysea]|uniref:Abortive infection protein n=1 Tax=Neptunitalea chrysea TaxID=1647581 RepID=A0A9W6B6Z5_9FLAO|nr:CPBP family intramembrane glutamic endopeptidase [Neptunitalea chrysea]GLB53681.1 abortive infection protein [Neptunitalea chrysea]
MYIEQALKSKHEWWRYLIGFVIVIVAWLIIGRLPMQLLIAYKKNTLGVEAHSLNEIINLLGNNTYLVLYIVSFAIGLFTLFVVVQNLHKFTILKLTTSRSKFDWNRFFMSFFTISLASLLTVYISYKIYPEVFILNFDLEKFVMLFLVVLLLPIQTSLEEYIFRGYLMQGLGVSSMCKWIPFIGTSVLFGIMHLGNPEIAQMGDVVLVFYIGTGFTLGIMTLMDEGMELALGFHAANNMIGALLVTADWTVIQTDSVFKNIGDPKVGIEIFIPIVIQILILFIFSKIYKWNGWKEKLFGKLHTLKEETTNKKY